MTVNNSAKPVSVWRSSTGGQTFSWRWHLKARQDNMKLICNEPVKTLSYVNITQTSCSLCLRQMWRHNWNEIRRLPFCWLKTCVQMNPADGTPGTAGASLFQKGERIAHYGDVWPYLFLMIRSSLRSRIEEGRSLIIVKSPGEYF
jgi:hypothetical protein